MTRQQWSEAEASAWKAEHPWICGFNFLPSSAVNFLEMWHPDTFDLPTIERELGWASKIGFNALRTNLHFLVWKNDRDRLLTNLDHFLSTANDRGLSSVICLFDDCEFGGHEPQYGPQPDPIPGVHNSRAVASPGRKALADQSIFPDLETYVRDIVKQLRNDKRVLFWDLYNEPGNRMVFEEKGFRTYEPDTSPHSLALMERSFDWARAENPKQPLTVGAWSTPPPGSSQVGYTSKMDQRAIELSDIVSFHAYCDATQLQHLIDNLERYRRPLYCTEWLARAVKSRIDNQLDILKQREVGCFQWGLVSGRTQTHLPWPAELVEAHGGNSSDQEWFQDLLHIDGSPHHQSEVDKISALAGSAG